MPTPARLAAALGGRLPGAGLRVGLLGGSFNPAHGGHLAVSQSALARLALDQIWWLVSPQNPLKPKAGMAELEERIAGAKRLVKHPKVRVTALESALSTRYSADTVRALKKHFPRVNYVWIIGADNLVQFSQWKDWQEIFNTTVIAVFDRPSYGLKALAAPAARRFARDRMAESRARQLAGLPPPAWVFLHGRLDPRSATALRTSLGRA